MQAVLGGFCAVSTAYREPPTQIVAGRYANALWRVASGAHIALFAMCAVRKTKRGIGTAAACIKSLLHAAPVTNPSLLPIYAGRGRKARGRKW
jgi:hypothetical protein